MEIFGIGPLELLFIILIAIIVLGPKDIEKTARAAGRGLYKLLRSDTWKTVSQTSRQLRDLPNELVRQAGIEELQKDLNKEMAGKPGPVPTQGAAPAERSTSGETALPAEEQGPGPDGAGSIPVESENRIAPPDHDKENPE